MPAPIWSALPLPGRDLSGATAIDPRADERRRLAPRILPASTAIPPRARERPYARSVRAPTVVGRSCARATASRAPVEPNRSGGRALLHRDWTLALVGRDHEKAPYSARSKRLLGGVGVRMVEGIE